MCRQGSFTKERSGLCGCGTALLDRGAAWRARLVFTGSGSGRFPAFGVQVDAGGAMPPMFLKMGTKSECQAVENRQRLILIPVLLYSVFILIIL